MCYTAIVLYTLILHAASTIHSVSPNGYLLCNDWVSETMNGDSTHFYVFEGDADIININLCGADFSSEIYVYEYDPIHETFDDSYVDQGNSNYAECGNRFKGSFLDNIPIQNGQSVIFSISDTNKTGGWYYFNIWCGHHSGPDTNEQITVCSIDCNETVTGFHQYGNKTLCEITSSAEYGIFDGCGSDYKQVLRIWDIYGYETAMSDWNNYCNDDTGYIEWNNWDNTIKQYLQIGGYESGNYSVSMQCGRKNIAPITVDCFIGCEQTVNGFIGDGQTVVCEIDSRAYYTVTTIDGCGSNYDQWLRIRNEFGWGTTYSDSNHHCIDSNHSTAYIEWYNDFYNDWSIRQGQLDAYAYYLEIGGNEAGNYSVSMQCNVATSDYEDVIFCGDTVSGNVSNGETNSYRLIIDSPLDKAYVMAGCNTDINMKMLAYSIYGYFRVGSETEYSWKCLDDIQIMELYTDGQNETFDLKIKLESSVETKHYKFNVICADNLPKGQIVANISCGDKNLLGHTDDTNRDSVYYNFINLKNQTVTFSAWNTGQFSPKFFLYDSTWNLLQESREYWNPNDWPRLTYHDNYAQNADILPSGHYIFGIEGNRWMDRYGYEYSEGGSFLLDITCDSEYDDVIFCGDTISGNVSNGEMNSYRLIIDSPFDKVYVIPGCNTDINIQILVYDTYGSFLEITDNHQQNEFMWTCQDYVQIIRFFTWGQSMTLDIKIKWENSVETKQYKYTVICADSLSLPNSTTNLPSTSESGLLSTSISSTTTTTNSASTTTSTPSSTIQSISTIDYGTSTTNVVSSTSSATSTSSPSTTTSSATTTTNSASTTISTPSSTIQSISTINDGTSTSVSSVMSRSSTTNSPSTTVSTSSSESGLLSTSKSSTTATTNSASTNSASTIQNISTINYGTTSLMVNTGKKTKLLINLVMTFIVMIENKIF